MVFEHMDVFITLVVAVFSSTGFWSWAQNRSKSQSNESKLLMGIAYAKIIQTAQEHIKKGYISADEYHELYHYLYEPYREMGGNGTAEKLINEVGKLPMRKGEEK